MRRRKQDYWMSSSNILKDTKTKRVKYRIRQKKTATCISVAVKVSHAKN